MIVLFISFITYLLLTWSGSWSIQDVTIAAAAGGVVFFALPGWSREKFWSIKGFSPRKWLLFLYYIFGPYAKELLKANLHVAGRVISGQINPGLIRFHPRLKTNAGRLMLANSITFPPGTYTVDIDDEGYFYIHVLYLTSTTPSEEYICGPCGQWSRRLLG